MIRLCNLYQDPGFWWAPYKLLEEREPHENISHKVMPTWTEHCAYVDSRPHRAWYAIRDSVDWVTVGCTYLSDQGEVGIGILKAHRRKGYASAALRALMDMHPGHLLANINPANEASLALFRSLGFAGPIQVTLERRP